jgi:hypothetical protein
MIQPVRSSTSFRGMIILGGCLIMVAFEIFVHWFMSKGYPFSNGLLQWYISRDPQSHKGVAGLLDSTLPMIALGFLIGWIGWQWSLEKLALFVFLIGSGIVALEPAYTIFLNKDFMWWLPNTTGDLIFFIIREGVFSILGVGVFTYGGRCFGEYYNHSAKK